MQGKLRDKLHGVTGLCAGSGQSIAFSARNAGLTVILTSHLHKIHARTCCNPKKHCCLFPTLWQQGRIPPHSPYLLILYIRFPRLMHIFYFFKIRMNDCLKTDCPGGYAFFKGLGQLDNSGSFRLVNILRFELMPYLYGKRKTLLALILKLIDKFILLNSLIN